MPVLLLVFPVCVPSLAPLLLWGHCGWAHEAPPGGWAGGSGEERVLTDGESHVCMERDEDLCVLRSFSEGGYPQTSPGWEGWGCQRPSSLVSAAMPFILWC